MDWTTNWTGQRRYRGRIYPDVKYTCNKEEEVVIWWEWFWMSWREELLVKKKSLTVKVNRSRTVLVDLFHDLLQLRVVQLGLQLEQDALQRVDRQVAHT